MIRLIYWFAILVEILLALAVLVIFIVTDSRTIKVLAQETLPAEFTYQNIEGNFFTGLTLRELSYQDKKLFSSAKVRWNPLTLLNQQITLKEFNAQGVEIENIRYMLENFESNSSTQESDFYFSLLLKNIHLDINPYVYEGVKFSSFVFETDRVAIDKSFLLNTKPIKLSFDSDLVDLKLKAYFKNSNLLVEELSLKEIDSKEISKLFKRLKRKNKSKKKSLENQKNIDIKKNFFIKKIKIKKLFATLKDVSYSPLKISKTKVFITDAEIFPHKNFAYKAKKITLRGKTNFGKVHYSGKIKNSSILAKGGLVLSQELFTKYRLPLNYKTLKTLNGTLKLTHSGVWLEAKHTSPNLLKLDVDFNVDVSKAQHKLYYDYSDNNLTIKSRLIGKMSYSEAFELENRVVIDREKGFRYEGNISLSKIKTLPPVVSNYLLEDLSGSFKGISSKFEIDLNSKLLKGKFTTEGYDDAKLFLKSKESNILLKEIIPSLPNEFKDEKLGVESETLLNFKNFKKSKTELKVFSDLINVKTTMQIKQPYNILFKADIPTQSALNTLDENINFSHFKVLEGEVLFLYNNYLIKVNNQNKLEASVEYDSQFERFENGKLILNGDELHLDTLANGTVVLKSHIPNIQKFLETLNRYYKIDLPSIQGAVDVDFKQKKDGTINLSLKSPNLKYLSDSGVKLSVINVYDIDLTLNMDKSGNIELEDYKFRIDNNGYINNFHAKKHSYLSFKKNELLIKLLWINDKIMATGNYNVEKTKGDINLKAKQYTFKNNDFDLLLDLDINVNVHENKKDISGDIDIFGNAINYEVVGSDIVSDSDIVIVRDMLEDEVSILKNLKLYLKINSKKALKYISKDTNIEFYNELSLLKNYDSDFMLTGMTTITKGYYQMEEKQFTLNESHIYFAGDPKKPLLDIKANYQKEDYLIHIFISGSTEEPIVNFNAEPYLTQQEILSLILFDGTGSSNGGGAEAYTLLGGTFAKGLIKSLGINVDHLLLGKDANDDLSFEIGRKVSKNVTVIYLHEDGKDGVKARIEHNRNFETDIIIQPPNSSSIEFLYKYID